jgi:hypothetical protein
VVNRSERRRSYYLKLPLPELRYQEDLANEVVHYDAVITASRKMISDLEALRAAAGSLAMVRATDLEKSPSSAGES